MKTFIIATILSAGVLLRPQMVPGGCNEQANHMAKVGTAASVEHVGPRILEKVEAESIRGNGIVNCVGWVDENLDKHGMCCLNLWLFRICVEVNISDVERLISSLI